MGIAKIIAKSMDLHKTGKSNAAIRKLRDALKKNPEDAEILASIAFIAQQTNKETLAQEFYKKAINLDNKNSCDL